MMTTLLVLSAVMIPSLVVFVHAIWTAPMGEEGPEGFRVLPEGGEIIPMNSASVHDDIQHAA